MEQKDYLLREIEKIGAVLRWIFGKVTGIEASDALTIETKFNQAKEMLLKETGFDADLFLSLKEPEIEQYISKFKGLNITNIELLADIYREMGTKTGSVMAKEYFARALKLYDICDQIDKTYLLERERKINEIKRIV